MKVVLLCGGQGMRMREYSESIPKPMVRIGYRPILWHLMKYYAHFGHKDFVLCLGHGGDHIKRYFLEYDETLSNDFKLTDGGRSVQLARTDIDDWAIDFVDTGAQSSVGERLWRIRDRVAADDVFMANYSDGLSDLPLDRYLDFFTKTGKVAAFVSMQPTHSFHVARVDDDGHVAEIAELARSGLWVNGGFFLFRREIFEFMRAGEELVEEPFQRLMAARELVSFRHEGFWSPMDTFKDKQRYDEMYLAGRCPWAVWREDRSCS
ncbi:MAG: sugar phosphate nucleotidyltransferase [Longimicrobiales bacterium]|nr:sugar phosphate nucleotidyltransferase [Longimicrobiales bacterium]